MVLAQSLYKSHQAIIVQVSEVVPGPLVIDMIQYATSVLNFFLI